MNIWPLQVLGFREEVNASSAKENLIEELKENDTSVTVESTASEVPVARTAEQRHRDELWEDLDQSVRASRPHNNDADLLTKEVQDYLLEPNIERKADPLLWWSKEGKMFPNVRKVALKYLIIPGMDLNEKNAELKNLSHFYKFLGISWESQKLIHYRNQFCLKL